jgi:antitoxin HicB
MLAARRLGPGPVRVISCADGHVTDRYTVVLEREEDCGYIASVPAWFGCVSQGDNRAEALNKIREAIELYIEDCRDAGDPFPTEAGKEFVEVEAAEAKALPIRYPEIDDATPLQ